ncbi:hypothetical protein [Planobispora takensis]|uniref:Uncharacterized protein n=1 Tax=Planobispora takensis TaxID=1367882 RepID=A0A8J3T426_9ACTN|nr:hypothetical protein [Planobispora takensis]GII05687.1 hypothetical protein Pta02_76950 [Planobispora takensis]
MSHSTAVWMDPAKAAEDLVGWISEQDFSANNNFTVAVYQGNDLVISKVGGITEKAAATGRILAYIRENSMHVGRKIYAAKAFATLDGPVSNHAEMCILAACGASNVNFIKCTSPNCKFCKATLKAYGVNNANADGPDGKSQIGWRHPFLQVSYGTALASREADQLAELSGYNQAKEIAGAPVHGQPASSAPKGELLLLLSG